MSKTHTITITEEQRKLIRDFLIFASMSYMRHENTPKEMIILDKEFEQIDSLFPVIMEGDYSISEKITINGFWSSDISEIMEYLKPTSNRKKEELRNYILWRISMPVPLLAERTIYPEGSYKILNDSNISEYDSSTVFKEFNTLQKDFFIVWETVDNISEFDKKIVFKLTEKGKNYVSEMMGQKNIISYRIKNHDESLESILKRKEEDNG